VVVLTEDNILAVKKQIPLGSKIMVNPEPRDIQIYIEDVGHEIKSYPYYRISGDNTLVHRLSLQYTISGCGRLVHRRGEYRLVPGSLLLVNAPSEYMYEVVAGEDWEFLYFSITGDVAQRLGRRYEAEYGPYFELDRKGLFLERASAVARSVLSGQVPDVYENSDFAYSLLMSLLREKRSVAPVEDSVAAPIINAMEFIRGNFHKELTLDKLAAEFAISKYHFSRLFKEHFGCPPGEFILRERLRNAMEMLETTGLTAREISYKCGFADYVHFGKIFRRKVGLTPMKYRENNHNISGAK